MFGKQIPNTPQSNMKDEIKPIQLDLFSPFTYNPEIRISKTFAHSVFSFDEQFKSEAGVLKSLVLFFHHEVQNNIFGMSVFDIKRFADMMNYDIKYLNSKAKNPAQHEGMDKQEIEQLYKLEEQDPIKYKVWNSVLENALWILQNKPVRLTYGGAYNTNDIQVVRTGQYSERYIRNLEMVMVDTSGKGKKKKIYIYELDREFVTKTMRYYAFIDIRKYPALQRKGIENMYLYLIDFINSMMTQNATKALPEGESQAIQQDCTLYFSALCNIFNVGGTIEKEKKRRIKEKMAILQEVLSEDDFKITQNWVKGSADSKYSYNLHLKIEIPKDRIKTKKEQEKDRQRNFKDLCYMRLFHETFSRLYPEIYYEEGTLVRIASFYNWLCNDEANMPEKIAAIKASNVEVYGETATNTLLGDRSEFFAQRSLQEFKEDSSIMESFSHKVNYELTHFDNSIEKE